MPDAWPSAIETLFRAMRAKPDFAMRASAPARQKMRYFQDEALVILRGDARVTASTLEMGSLLPA